MKTNRLVMLTAAIIGVAALTFFLSRPKALPKLGLTEMFINVLSSATPIERDASFALDNLPREITKEQASKIKKYRLGGVQLFLVGRASGFFPYYGPDLSVSAFRALPSGVFASVDNGQSWNELIASDSVSDDPRFADVGLLEPAGIFTRNKRLFADFAYGSEGSLMRLSSVDGKKWSEYGCYYYLPEKYDDPFSLDANARCLKFDPALDDWVPAGLKPSAEVNQSRETLLAYLGALSMGWYEEAAALYDGSHLDTLRYWNPDTKADDVPGLFAATCSRQTICTWPLTVTPSNSDREKHKYSFEVILPLGKTTSDPTRKFTYTVKENSDGKYTVESLSGYVQ